MGSIAVAKCKSRLDTMAAPQPVRPLIPRNAPPIANPAGPRADWDKGVLECCFVKDCGCRCCCITFCCGPCAYSDAVRWIHPDLGKRAFWIWILSLVAKNATNHAPTLRAAADVLEDGAYVGIRQEVARLTFGGEDTAQSFFYQCCLPSCARCQEINELMLWYERKDTKGRSVRYGNPLCCQTFEVYDLATKRGLGHPKSIVDPPEPEVPSRNKRGLAKLLPPIMARS